MTNDKKELYELFQMVGGITYEMLQKNKIDFHYETSQLAFINEFDIFKALTIRDKLLRPIIMENFKKIIAIQKGKIPEQYEMKKFDMDDDKKIKFQLELHYINLFNILKHSPHLFTMEQCKEVCSIIKPILNRTTAEVTFTSIKEEKICEKYLQNK